MVRSQAREGGFLPGLKARVSTAKDDEKLEDFKP